MTAQLKLSARDYCLRQLKEAHTSAHNPGGWVCNIDLMGKKDPVTNKYDKGGKRPEACIKDLQDDGWGIESARIEIGGQLWAAYRLTSLRQGAGRGPRKRFDLTEAEMWALHSGTVPPAVRDRLAEKLEISANQTSLIGGAT